MVSESASGATVGDTFRTTTTPVVVAESYILDDMGMVPAGSTNYGNTATDQTQVGVTAGGAVHPLGAGLPVGDATTSTVPMSHGWGKPAAAATVAATLPADATKAVVFGYDSGAAMASGTAPGRRVGWFHYSGAATSLTDTAAVLFDAAVAWAGATTAVVRYVRDATDRIVERKVNDRVVARYSYTAGGDTSDLTLDADSNLVEATLALPGGVLYTWRSTSPVWSYPNLHGDLALTTDTAGVKQGPTRVWDPWGKPFTVTGEQDNSAGEMDYGWHGSAQRPLEHQTGVIPTIEMGARQYAPTLGRFLEIDPVEGGTANDYLYVGDPVNQADLTGELNPSEVGFCVENPNECRKLGGIKQALDDTYDCDRNRCNAMKHLILSATLGLLFGKDVARTMLNNHEANGCAGGGDLNERMDCHNNAIGLMVGVGIRRRAGWSGNELDFASDAHLKRWIKQMDSFMTSRYPFRCQSRPPPRGAAWSIRRSGKNCR